MALTLFKSGKKRQTLVEAIWSALRDEYQRKGICEANIKQIEVRLVRALLREMKEKGISEIPLPNGMLAVMDTEKHEIHLKVDPNAKNTGVKPHVPVPQTKEH